MREVSLGVAMLPLSLTIIFFLILLYINRKSFGEQAFNQFATASKTFGVWAITMSLMATWFVGSSYTAWMGMSVQSGFIYAYTPVYCTFGLIFLYLIIDKVWIWGASYTLNTQASLWALRYNSKYVKPFVGIVGMAASFPWLIMEFWTIAYLLQHGTYGYLPFMLAMFIGVILIVVYVSLGGMRAVITANFVQGLVFVLGSTVFTYYLVNGMTGGLGDTFRYAFNNYKEMLTFPGPGWGDTPPPITYWTSLCVTCAVGGFLWPWTMNRIYAAQSPKVCKQATWQCLGIAAVICFGFQIFGISAHSVPYAVENPQTAWLWIADSIGGPLVVAIALVVAAAATVSTVSGLIHFFGTSIAEDVIRPFKPDVSDKTATLIARITVGIVSLIAFIIANMELPMLIFVALLMYQFIIQLGPGQLLGMYWKRANKYGAVLGLIAGVSVTFYITFTDPTGYGLGGWMAGVWGLLVNLIVYVVCGFLVKQDPRTDELFQEVEDHKKKALNNGAETVAG